MTNTYEQINEFLESYTKDNAMTLSRPADGRWLITTDWLSVGGKPFGIELTGCVLNWAKDGNGTIFQKCGAPITKDDKEFLGIDTTSHLPHGKFGNYFNPQATQDGQTEMSWIKPLTVENVHEALETIKRNIDKSIMWCL